MKIIFQISNFLHKTRNYSVLSICSVFSIISCNLSGNIEHVNISTEDFIPQGLCEKSRMFCFLSDSIGYAVSTKDTLVNGIEKEWSVVSHTQDRGRTWIKYGEFEGRGTSISRSCSNIFFTTVNTLEDYSLISEIWKLNNVDSKFERISRIDNAIFGFHAFDDMTYCYFPHYGGDMADFYLTYDSGGNWQKKKLPGTSAGLHCCSYSKDKIFCTIFGSDLFDNKLYVFDIARQMGKCIRIGDAHDVVMAADTLLAFAINMSFYHYSDSDGRLAYISCFKWSRRFGRYFPHYMTDSNGIVICSGSEFYAKKGKHNCIFYSTDSGLSWEAIIMNDYIMQNDLLYNENAMTDIPTEYGASVLYQRYEDNMLHIINIKEK